VDLPSQKLAPRIGPSTLIAGFYAALGVGAVAWGAARGDADIYRLAGHTSPLRMLVSPFIGVIVGVGVVLIWRLAVRRMTWARRLHQEFRHVLGPLSPGQIFVLALASSVGEELFFRGAMMPSIHLWPSAAVFALPHIGPGLRFLPWTVSAFAMGLMMGVLFSSIGDLGAPIAAHFTINYLNLHHITENELVI
jgi:membrane protease YdiL (CAAX protease family)